MATAATQPVRESSHRPWPPPPGRHAINMIWHDLLFIHWPVPVETLRPHIPKPLAVDTYEGQAWIGVVPFYMTGVCPAGCPNIPWLCNFAELNVRTYVTVDDKPGVWFLSLDAHQAIAAWIARRTFRLPYYNAVIEYKNNDGRITFASRRTHRRAAPARFAAEYQAAGDVYRTQPGDLDHWLISRYCLYAADGKGNVYRGDIDHDPWPLQRAEARITTSTMTHPFHIIPPKVTPRLHYAARLEAKAWKLTRVHPSASS
ncbi:MAG: DUF2071 domain-containing protein [Pirellulales bacterium]